MVNASLYDYLERYFGGNRKVSVGIVSGTNRTFYPVEYYHGRRRNYPVHPAYLVEIRLNDEYID
jgi:hypothetical protein